MHDELDNQKISRLIDGDLGYDETLDLLKNIQSNDSLKTKMCRYQAISQALKTDEFYQVKSDFSTKVFQEIQREPAHFLPQLKQQAKPRAQNKYPTRTTMFAVAASALVAVVLVGQNLRNAPLSSANYQTIAAASIPSPQMVVSMDKPGKLKQNRRQPLSAQFNDYLQAHNSSVYTNGEANFQPYATVTSYGQR